MNASFFEKINVISNTGSSDASMDFNSLIFTDGVNDKSDLERQFSGWGHDQSLDVVGSCVNNLQCCNGKSTGLSCTRLRLSNCIVSLDNWKDTFHLDGGGLVETITVNTSKGLLL